MSGCLLQIVRIAILMRKPRLTYWYWRKSGRKRLPDPANPKTANDKFFWRKIFDRSPEFTEVSDKLRVRDWLKARKIEIDAPPVLWSGKDPSQIPDTVLAGGVFAKANHGSGTNILLHDQPVDRAEFDQKMRGFLKKPHGKKRLEWGYFDIDRTLMIEKLIPNITTEFKAYTYGDKIEMLVIIYDRFEDICADIWLPDGQAGWVMEDRPADVGKRANRPLPKNTPEAMNVSREIGTHFDHMRVDILSDGNKLWFSELTIYNMAGRLQTIGGDPDLPSNKSWDLEASWFMRTPQRGWKRAYAALLRRAIVSAQ